MELVKVERFVFLAVLLFLATHLLVPQTLPRNPEKEAPETVFQTKVGDADVDLRLDGYWDASLRGSLGAAVVPGKGIQYPAVFPGFPDGLIYEQKPNLTLALWLLDRYFFETTLQEKRQLNSYVLGYQGKEGELLQSLRAGNKGIEISPYPYMDFPGGSRSSPGIAARLQTERTQHEFLLRYDPSQPVKKTYLGKNSVEELRIDPPAFAQGRFFVLPDPEVDAVEVYLEDYKGSFLGSDGRKYRRATEFDVSLSRSEGLVSLQKPSPGRVVVYYEKGGAPVGSPSLGKKALPPFVKTDVHAPWQVDPLGEGEDFSWSPGTLPGCPHRPIQGYPRGETLPTPVRSRRFFSLSGLRSILHREYHGTHRIQRAHPSRETRIRRRLSSRLPCPSCLHTQ